MLRVSIEQQKEDHAVVSSCMKELHTMSGEAWEARYLSAVARVEDLYQEFTPGLHPRALMLGKLLGGAGMAFVETRYGSDAEHACLYSGKQERDALAMYHNGTHSWEFMRNMFRYATLINERDGPDAEGRLPYDEDFFLRVPHIAASHDRIIGNGRMHDERQAALLAGYLMMRIGGTLQPDEESMAAVEATTWDERQQRQLTYPGETFPLYRTAAKVSDLLTTRDRQSIPNGIYVIMENMTKRFQGRILTLEAQQRGFDLLAAGMEERLEFADSNEATHKVLDTALKNQAPFLRNCKLADPSVSSEFPGLQDHADFMEYLYDGYGGKSLTINDVWQEAKAYAAIP